MAIKLEKKHYNYMIVVLAGGILVSILLSLFVLKPLYKKSGSLSKEVKEKREVLNALENKLTTLQALKPKEDELVAEKEKVLAALPEGKDIPRLFVQIEKTISDTGAVVESAAEGMLASSTGQTGQSVSVDGITNHTYSIKFGTSTYESIKNAVINVENALRISQLASFSISMADNSFSTNISLTTYSRTPKGVKQ